ncbi:MAG: tRNA (adenosine(37)-N6)-dimethylallyltransferase MiaA [Pseudomonadota bacterium]
MQNAPESSFEKKPPVILIAGPTASGKSALALDLADHLGADIINADASQVYGDLHILSARPGADDLARAPHHLYGHVGAGERYSVGRWAVDCGAALTACAERHRAAIVVGGTGLYFRALETGLSPIPSIPEERLREGMARYEEIGPAQFAAETVAVDPPMARIAVNDRQRLVRAWSVYRHFGVPLSDFQARPGEPVLPQAPAARLIVMPPREALYARCDQRFEAMVAAGALAEVEALMASGLDPTLPIMAALGVRELGAHLSGSLTLAEATALAQRNTRRFAKRQMTWFRNQTAIWPVAHDASTALQLLKNQLAQ